MSNIEPLQHGQEVFLKRPCQIYAEVIGPIAGDSGLPEEQVRYAVQLMPLEQCYVSEDLEAAQWPQSKKSSLESSSPEPIEEPISLSERSQNLPADDRFFDLAQEISNLIAGRAYKLYECRGYAHGHDAEDWLRAESEILLNVPAEIAERETRFTIRADVSGFNENDLEVRVAPSRVYITGKQQEVSTDKSAFSERRPNRIFRALDLPSEVDPASADATIGGGILEVKLLKSGMRKVIPVRARAASA